MTEEEAIVAAEAEEAIKDKDKSNHRLIGGSNKNEGSDSDSGEIPAVAPAKVRRRVRRDSGGGGWKIPVNSGFTNKNWTLNPKL